tara:strand:- start:45042 stop:45209 length:168 start_codon:yes stop_codon:yes gene_type:complete
MDKPEKQQKLVKQRKPRKEYTAEEALKFAKAVRSLARTAEEIKAEHKKTQEKKET